jgi:RNase P subunit RPR2
VDLPAGLEPGTRYRCDACGNLTRFDVETVERVRRFWHAELSGLARVEESSPLEVEVVAVTCRWCGSADAIEVVEAPGAEDAAGGPEVTSGG